MCANVPPPKTGIEAGVPEVVFNWPGLGTLIVDALTSRDYPVLQGVFLFVSISVVLANLAADAVYGVLDPRVKA